MPNRPHHLGLDPGVFKKAVITGDPHRVEVIASLFGGAYRLADDRGYLCYGAKVGNAPTVVVASGIGGPSTAIAVEELIEVGVRIIIRIGTCGALQLKVKPGDLVIPTACVRADGTTAQYIEPIFPAVPDFRLLARLVEAARTRSIQTHVGITHCKDAYYLEQPGKQIDPERGERIWKTWRAAGVLSTEMESSTLFVLGSLRGIQTAAVFINVGKSHDEHLFHSSLAHATAIVTEALLSSDDDAITEDEAIFNTDQKSYLEPPGKAEYWVQRSPGER